MELLKHEGDVEGVNPHYFFLNTQYKLCQSKLSLYMPLSDMVSGGINFGTRLR